MLRFRSIPPRANAGLTKRDRRRLWMLVVALGLVVALMRQLGQPETAQRLEHLFTALEQTNESPAIGSDVASPHQESTAFEPDQAEKKEDRLPSDRDTIDDLSGIKDKTYFRPEERSAWFSLFAKLRKMDQTKFSIESVRELTYAQLLQQPDEYRGRLVSIRGTVLRSELQRPVENEQGVESYHRLWIEPRGGGQWPFVVYCLELPVGFPTGDNLREMVSATGYFFKNWSYSYGEGLGLAPVILAKKITWQKPVVQPATKPITSRHWAMGVTIACVFAALAIRQLLRRNQRRPLNSKPDYVIQQALQQLASEGNDT